MRETVNFCEEKIELLEGKIDELNDANGQLTMEKELLEKKVEGMSVEIVDLRRVI